MQVFKAALTYFSIVFCIGFVMGVVRVLLIVPRAGETLAVLIEGPLMLAASYFAAHFVLRVFAVPANAGARSQVGLGALALLMTFELATALGVRKLSFTEYLASFETTAGLISAVLFLLFALMPLVAGRRTAAA